MENEEDEEDDDDLVVILYFDKVWTKISQNLTKIELSTLSLALKRFVWKRNEEDEKKFEKSLS